MMMPDIQVSLITVLSAVVANFFFGFVWFTLIFGKIWAVEMGFDPDEKPPMGVMLKGMSLNVVGYFFLAWVFAHNIAVWNPETWGLGPSEMSLLANAGMAAVFTWLGFFVPLLLNSVAWEKKSWKLFGINSIYHLLSLFLIAVILTHL